MRDFGEREILVSLGENDKGNLVQNFGVKFGVLLNLIEKNLCDYFCNLLNFYGYFCKFS